MANSTTTLPFQLAFATVAGRMHHLSGRNNQDAYAWTQGPGGLIAVVCDGCGSGPHSEVGAQVGARLVACFHMFDSQFEYQRLVFYFWLVVEAKS